LGRTVFVAEVENFLAVGIEDEQLGGRELLADGQVDEFTGGSAVEAGEQGQPRPRGEGLN